MAAQIFKTRVSRNMQTFVPVAVQKKLNLKPKMRLQWRIEGEKISLKLEEKEEDILDLLESGKLKFDKKVSLKSILKAREEFERNYTRF